MSQTTSPADESSPPPADPPVAARAAPRIVARSIVGASLGVSLVSLVLMGAAVSFSHAAQLGPLLGILLTGIAVLGALAFAAVAGRRAARSLEALTQEAEALRNLDTSHPAPVASGVAELDRLGDAMRQMKQALGVVGVYIPRDLTRQLLSQGAELRLGGERRQLTVMFSDVQDFTRISEHADPVELMRITSAYFEAMTAELLRNQGTIDKYIGDAVMAFWNAPKRDLAHALHACQGALRARQVTRELAASFAQRGWPTFHTRFGLHTGEAVVGNVGSSDRMSYTAIGAMVNLASRLEGLNKVYGTQILVSEATVRGAGSAFVFRPLDLVTPRGTGDPVEIFELLGLARAREAADEKLLADRAALERLPAWREMVQHYRASRFAEAERALAEAGGAQADGVAAIYAERLARLRNAPPGPGWTPVIAYQRK